MLTDYHISIILSPHSRHVSDNSLSGSCPFLHFLSKYILFVSTWNWSESPWQHPLASFLYALPWSPVCSFSTDLALRLLPFASVTPPWVILSKQYPQSTALQADLFLPLAFTQQWNLNVSLTFLCPDGWNVELDNIKSGHYIVECLPFFGLPVVHHPIDGFAVGDLNKWVIHHPFAIACFLWKL